MEKFKAFWEAYGETTVMIVACSLAVILFAIAIVNQKKGKFTSKMISNGAISIALAMILNLLPAYSMPNGGSVTLARLLPLVVFAYVYGFGPGCVIGAMYGLLDFAMKPYFLNIIQFLLDYPLAFAGVGFAGLNFFKNPRLKLVSLVIGTVITGLSRWAFSTASGVLYWGVPFIGSLTY
ncbi:MAG: energy-coupled thiamine transporter ThiT, partial [Clostridia bacterium]